MFCGCGELKEIIGLNNFKTNNVMSMKIMFFGCTEITSLDLSNFNTSNVTNMSQMFTGCKKLEYLNIKNFQLKNKCDIEAIFLDIDKKKCKIITDNNILKNEYNRG